MGYENIDFLSEEDKETFKDQEEKTKEEDLNKRVVHKPDDGLNSICENCGDRKGGCSDCGWRKNDV